MERARKKEKYCLHLILINRIIIMPIIAEKSCLLCLKQIYSCLHFEAQNTNQRGETTRWRNLLVSVEA